MSSKKYIICFTLVFTIVLGLMYSSAHFRTPIKNNSKNTELSTKLKSAAQYADTNYLTYRYEWGDENVYNEAENPPNIMDILNNVTSFAEENDTVYLGDDEIPEPLMEGTHWTLLQVNLTALYVYDDCDLLKAGDIFVRWVPNYLIGPVEHDANLNWDNYQWIDEFTVDHDLYNETARYSINENDHQWYNFTAPITLYEGWTVLSCLLLEVLDQDVDPDDSLGMMNWTFAEPSSLVGLHEFSLDLVDVAINITILDTDNTFTAHNLTQLYEPFLFDNDDTDHTREPNNMSARVIHGFDSVINRNVFCIQYIYYWTEVWRDCWYWSDEKIHNDDYEVVQIYLNFSYTGDPTPYRFVFDNQDTYENTPTGWRTDMKYSIYELDATQENIDDTIEISPELKPLLGPEYNVSYYKLNSSDFTKELSGCFGGVPSLFLTINTSYHQFAMGRITSLIYLGEEAEILGQSLTRRHKIIPINTNYTPLTNNSIYNYYARLNYSLTEGFSNFDGEDIPNYSPFCYDVLQVFTEPYIHSSYDFIMQNAIKCKDETEAQGGFIKVVKRSVNFTFTIPLKTNINLPDVLTPGENLTTILETILDESNAILTIDYFFNITANCSVYFAEKYFEAVIENRIVIDFSNPIVQLFNKFLDFCFDRIFTIDIGSYVTLDIQFTPQLLGEILDCNVTVHLIEILRYFFPQYIWILDLFFEDLYFKINPIISGYLSAKVKLGNTNQTIVWDTITKNFDIDLKIPDLSYGNNLSLEIINFTYGLNFLVDWYFGYIPSFILKFLIGDGDEFYLGQFPNINFDLASIEGNVTLKTWDAYATTWGTASVGGVAPSGGGGGGGGGGEEEAIPGYDFFIIIGIISITSIILMKKRYFYKKIII